jgi:signal transduction histidine kinase
VIESRAPGLRVQILLALGALMVLAFAPLFFAVASVTRATLLDAHESAARALGRAVAADVGDVRGRDPRGVARVLESHVGPMGIEAAVVFDAGGARETSAGSAADLASIAAPPRPYREGDARVRGAQGRALDVTVPIGDAVVVARLRTDDDADRAAPLVRLVALYMGTFALALLTFAYFALTRLIVRPIDALVRAADRVASGARALVVPRTGASELADLSLSVQSMTTKLVADESALRAKVDELTRTTARLVEARDQLVRSEQMAGVGRLAAGLAHEVGNPIAAILGMEDLLLEGGLTEAEQREFIVRMKRETERIHGILRDLLDYARPVASSPTSSPSSLALPAAPVDVSLVVDDVLALVRPQRHFKGLRVTADLGEEPVRVTLAAQRLTQVLLNVVLNAGAAIASRGAPTADDAIVVRVRPAGKRARIEVEDTGPGVPPEMRERIFEPFVTTKDVGEGTGLGLAVCRGVVEAAGGTIAVDPSYTRGARIVIDLPAA